MIIELDNFSRLVTFIKHLSTRPSIPSLTIPNSASLFFLKIGVFLLIFISKYQGPSWSWSYGSWIYNYIYMSSVPFTTNVVTSNPTQAIQHYVIKFVSDLQQVSGFLRVLKIFSINKTDRQDITEILLKVALNTINQTTL